MMNDKELNDFTKSVIKEADLEQPSSDFLQNVMNKVKAESLQHVEVTYKPLISKTGWLIISLIVLFGVLSAINSGSSFSYFAELDLTFFNNFNFELPNITFSKIFTFSVVFLAIIASFQIIVIQKIYFKKTKE